MVNDSLRGISASAARIGLIAIFSVFLPGNDVLSSEPLQMARALVEAPRLVGHPFEDAPFDVSTDGKKLVYALVEPSIADNRTSTSIWLQDISRWSARIRLAEEESPGDFTNARTRLSPDGSTVLFVSAPRRELVFIDIDTRRRHVVRPEVGDGGSSAAISFLSTRWSPDGRRVALLFSQPAPHATINQGVEPGIDWHPTQGFDPAPDKRIAVVDALSGAVAARSRRGIIVRDFSWSPDSLSIAFSGDARGNINDFYTGSGDETALFLLNAATGVEKKIVDRPGYDANLSWSPDGSKIAFDTTISGEINSNWVQGIYEVTTGQTTVVPRGDLNAYGSNVWLDGRRIARFTQSAMGCPIIVLDVVNGVRTQVTPDDLSCKTNLLRPGDSRALYFVNASFSDLDQISEIDIDDWQSRPVTHFSPRIGFPPNEVKVVSWPMSGEKGLVHGILVIPKDGRKGKRPFVVSIAGGPHGVTPVDYNFNAEQFVHPLLMRGFAVLLPNTRGRSGYGRTFAAMIRDHADYLPGPFADVMGGVDLVVNKLKIVDPARMAVMGFSYGAHLGAWTIAHSNVFRAAALSDPVIVDYVSFGRMFPNPLQERVDRTVTGFRNVYTDIGRQDRERNSPINFVQNTKTPVLLQCGVETAASVYAGCQMLAAAYRYFKLPTEFVVFPRTAHGVTEPALRFDGARREIEWLDYWVLGKPVPRLEARFGVAVHHADSIASRNRH